MAGSKSSYFADAVAGLSIGTAYAAPSSVYIALFPADPGATGTDSTEFTNATTSWSGYARQKITPGAVANGSWTSTTTIQFPANGSSSSVSVGGWGIYDAATAGNLLYHGAFTSAQTVASGQPFQVPSGDVTVSES